MEYNKLEVFVSKPRLNRFLYACGGSKPKALELYKSNLLISEAFYPILNLFEIFLRNNINHKLVSHFQDPDWIQSQKCGFMNDKSLVLSKYFLKNSISTAETKLAKKGIQITSGRLLAEQSFGFWVSLFDPHHYRLLQGSIIHCFPLKPKRINRKDISVSLKYVRDFRNRVYHNEPLCFNSSSINLSNAENIHIEIYRLLSWIDTELVSYVKYYDKIQKRIATAKSI